MEVMMWKGWFIGKGGSVLDVLWNRVLFRGYSLFHKDIRVKWVFFLNTTIVGKGRSAV